MADGKLVSASTPTEAGFAQVFDTSGLVHAMERKELRAEAKAKAAKAAQQKAQEAALKKREELLKKSDNFKIGALNDVYKAPLRGWIKEFDNFWKSNASSLTSANPDIDVQLELQARERRLMERIDGANVMSKELSEWALKLNDPEYDTPENHKIFDELTKALKEGNEDAFDRAIDTNRLSYIQKRFDEGAFLKRMTDGMAKSETDFKIANKGTYDLLKTEEGYQRRFLEQNVKADVEDHYNEHLNRYRRAAENQGKSQNPSDDELIKWATDDVLAKTTAEKLDARRVPIGDGTKKPG